MFCVYEILWNYQEKVKNSKVFLILSADSLQVIFMVIPCNYLELKSCTNCGRFLTFVINDSYKLFNLTITF